MNILVVLPDNSLGGISTSAENFCKECITRGNEVDVLIMNGGRLSLSNVNYVSMPGKSKYWNLSANDIKQGGIKAPLLAFMGVVKYLTNKKGGWIPSIFSKVSLTKYYDVTIAYRQSAACYYFTLNCVKAKTKLAMIHGNLHFMPETKTWDCLLPNFDKVICVSDAVRKGFAEGFPILADKFATVYNMFDAPSIIDKSNQPCEYVVDKCLVNIISVARHDNWQKNTDRIPLACAELRKRGVKNFHWYIAGDGPHLEQNKQLAKELGVYDMITFCGAMANPFALQSQCDISVLTSSTEAYSMSVIESRILKKPMIVMRYDGIAEAIEDGKSGLIAEQNMDSLCDKLQILIQDSVLRESMHQYLLDSPYSNEKAFCQFEDLVDIKQ